MSERTEELQSQIGELDDADDIMMNIMEVFSETEIVPNAGKYYTFVYNAKTPGVYDECPLVAVTGVENWDSTVSIFTGVHQEIILGMKL